MEGRRGRGGKRTNRCGQIDTVSPHLKDTSICNTNAIIGVLWYASLVVVYIGSAMTMDHMLATEGGMTYLAEGI